jgi:ubiquinone/menaquinone biosynthesis C-methylase UbiE
MNDDLGRAYWNRHAASYDWSMGLLGGPLPRMITLVAEGAQGAPRVLEVGSGSGLVTTALAEAAHEVVAVDYASEMVATTEARMKTGHITNVRCLQGDLYALPFEAGSFAIVVAANVLHLVPDLPRAIAALSSLLAPDGTLVVPTFLHAETRVARLVSRGLALTGFPGARRLTHDALCAALTAHDLVVVRSEVIPGILPIGYVEARAR